MITFTFINTLLEHMECHGHWSMPQNQQVRRAMRMSLYSCYQANERKVQHFQGVPVTMTPSGDQSTE